MGSRYCKMEKKGGVGLGYAWRRTSRTVEVGSLAVRKRSCTIWKHAWKKEEKVIAGTSRQLKVLMKDCMTNVVNYRWLSMKKVIASCGSKYLAYLEVEVEYQGSSGLLLQPELPEYKWERITKDIVVKLPSVIILWAVTGDVELNGSNLVQETTNKIVVMEGRRSHLGEILDEFWTHWIKEFLKGICKRVRTLRELGEVHKTTLPSQTVTNPHEQINAITTRSGKTCEGPSTPLVPTPVVSTPLKEPEQNPETSMDKVQKPSLESTAQVPPPEEEDSIFIEIPKPKAKKTVNIEIQEPNSPKPTSYQPKLPYPERMKVRENDKPSAQHNRFLKMFKQLRLEIGLKDALVEMPKFNKWLSGLLTNKEKLEEIAITTVNVECSAIIMNKVPEKLEDPGKFLIPCALQELDRTNTLADSGASINLLPYSIYKQLGLEALTPT
ncbi:hypothetical protein Tco_0601864 [Tanacetum coccineum]